MARPPAVTPASACSRSLCSTAAAAAQPGRCLAAPARDALEVALPPLSAGAAEHSAERRERRAEGPSPSARRAAEWCSLRATPRDGSFSALGRRSSEDHS
uniref:Uncharacterized protein n=1 Tax=Chlamydomonas euryale TaxID=1486919 RepID=A0A7R9Z0T3_9CHLO|eukprot:365898-Chlamydomonas_euryale.AAC.7